MAQCRGIEAGPLFRTFTIAGEPQEARIGDRDVARIVQRLTRRIEGNFAAPSLRAGYVTSAAAGVPEADFRGHRAPICCHLALCPARTLFDGSAQLRMLKPNSA